MPARRTANAPAGGAARDRAVVARVAADYIESWFAGDRERMLASLHPDLAKRSVEQDAGGDPYLDTIGMEEMVKATSGGAGKKHPPGHDVVVFDIDVDVATVKVTSAPYVEYLHLARFGERWLVVNVLWRSRPNSAPDR